LRRICPLCRRVGGRPQENAVPIGFWLMIALFVVVGFMFVNIVYWSNLRYDQEYRRKRYAALKQQTPPQPGQDD
jgi:hypothetical protein